jgi:Domain of unknown function (DU1801)
MLSNQASIADYLKGLPEGRRKAIAAVRKAIRSCLPNGYEEVMNWGMITYQVPLKTFPDTYNGKPLMYAALANQKNHMAVYLCALYCMPGALEKFKAAYNKIGKRLNMGASCIRFTSLDSLDLEAICSVIGEWSVAEFVKAQEAKASSAHKAGRR